MKYADGSPFEKVARDRSISYCMAVRTAGTAGGFAGRSAAIEVQAAISRIRSAKKLRVLGSFFIIVRSPIV
jgi:hypothetical protein